MAIGDKQLTLAQALELSMNHFQAGRLPQAEIILEQILTADPNHAGALNLVGCIAQRKGKADQALALFDRALQHHPNDDHIHFNRGLSLEKQGRLEEALQSYLRVTELRPEHTRAPYKVALTLHALGRLQEAANYYRRTLALDPANAAAHNNLGVILYGLGQVNEAVACYRQALALAPDYADAHNNLGSGLRDLGDSESAAASFRRAIELKPDYALAYNNLGNTLRDLGDNDQALSCYHKAVQLKPDYAEALINQGNILHAQGKLDEALDSYHRALSVLPDNPIVHTHLGATLQELGRYDEALSHFQKAMELRPDIAATHWNLALVQLLRGDFAAGLQHFEWRLEGAQKEQMTIPRETLAKLAGKPRWQGEALNGRRLLVWNDQAQGDAIMMARYFPLLEDKGAASVMVACQPSLVSLLQSLPSLSQVIPNGSSLPMEDFDCHCPLMSLPFLFGTRLDTIPNAVPYFHVPSTLSEKWHTRLTDLPGLKVGLAWAGSRTQQKDALRSIAFDRLDTLLDEPDVQFISLQKGETDSHPALKDWMVECKDFLDTAALIQQLDLVISVDTAIAHLAGALGKPVWLLNRYESEWRWMLDREDSPWYPTMRIFRQTQLHDWESVIARVTEELQSLKADH